MMRAALEQRLKKLKAEFESGQKMLTDVENHQAELQKTLLRISGAIQVIEEVLAEDARPSADGSASERTHGEVSKIATNIP